jgi:hypothetical protein
MQRLLLHEGTREAGMLERTWLEVEDDALSLVIDAYDADEAFSRGRREGAFSPNAERAAVPLAFLDGIMRRYGKALDDSVVLEGPRIEVEGRTLGMLRYRPLYDVIAKDYFVYAQGDATPLVELATSVTAALVYLVRQASLGAADD